MSLTNVARQLTADELAREPRSLGLIAYLDGYGQATGLRPMTYPRLLSTAEAEHWREGWAEGKAADAAWNAAQQPTEEHQP